jgi:hypothetical protein
VISSFLLLCERAGTAYPINDFIAQASAILGQIENDWLSNHALSPRHSSNKRASLHQRKAAALHAGDEARRVERLAYRIRQIQLIVPEFAMTGKNHWEREPRWQPLRRYVEQLLVAYDWGEAFVGLNLILKPMVDELFMKQMGELALGQNDHLLGQILYSLNEDCQWHRDWSRELVQVLTADSPSNKVVIGGWITKWRPKALLAVDAFAGLFESKPIGQGENLFHNLTEQIDDFGAEFLEGMALERS